LEDLQNGSKWFLVQRAVKTHVTNQSKIGFGEKIARSITAIVLVSSCPCKADNILTGLKENVLQPVISTYVAFLIRESKIR
jgi:hypothetical protein